MNWTPITPDDLNDSAVAQLVVALRTRALADDQDDPAPRIIADTVREVRRKIASNRQNKTDADTATVPASLRRLTVDLVLFELKGRLQIELNEDERAKLKAHGRTLDRIASGEDVIDEADAPAAPAVQGTGGSPKISHAGADKRRRRRKGL